MPDIGGMTPEMLKHFNSPQHPPDQAAQEVDKLLGKFDPLDISHNDFVRQKPQIKAALLALMYRENLAVIGPNESDTTPLEPYTEDGMFRQVRDTLRAEQRQAAAQRYKQEGGD